MGSIQLALSDPGKAAALSRLLSRSTTTPVSCVETPDFAAACVVVMDTQRYSSEPGSSANADRIVLIAHNDESQFKAAWDAGVNSVISDQDPLDTVVLAVLSACLRVGAAKQKVPGARPM